MVTIRDVAREAGVSAATVSRVLNEPSMVTPAKRRVVEHVIADLNFRPNMTARSLKSKSSRTIALIVSDISNRFFAEFASAVDVCADGFGYDILLCNLAQDKRRLRTILDRLPQRGVDGVILCGDTFLQSEQVVPTLVELVRSGLPVVMSGHPISDLEVPTVVNDTDTAFDQLVEHLVARGRTCIAYLGGPERSAIARRRLAYFTERAAEFRLPIVPEQVLDYDFAAGYDAAVGILDRLPVDAMVCADDQIAIGAMRAAVDRGMSTPADLAVVGFDDTALARYSTPRLTSISVDIAGTGVAAIQKVIDAIEGRTTSIQTHIECSLVIRESS